MFFPMLDQEHTLTPVSVRAGGPRCECHALTSVPGPFFCSSGGRNDVVPCELEEGVEPDDEAIEGVDVFRQSQGEGSVGEGKVLFGDGMEGKVEKGVGRSGHGGWFEMLDKDLVANMGQHARHFEAIYGMPEGNMLRDIIGVCEGGDVQRHVGRDHQAMWSKIAIACPKHRVEHRFVQKTVAHPFGDDDVNLVDWETHFFNFAMQASEIRFSGLSPYTLLKDQLNMLTYVMIWPSIFS